MSYQQILYGVAGQSLTLNVPDGVNPSSVTSVGVFLMGTGDDGTAVSATTGAAAVSDSGNFANIAVASGASESNPNLIQVDDISNFRQHEPYLLIETGVGSEIVEIVEIDITNNYLYSRHPLHHDYTTAADIGQTRIEIAIDDTWAADSANITDDLDPNPGYRVRWVYEGDLRDTGDFAHVVDTYFDLVRYESITGVTALDVDRLSPGWLSGIPQEYREDRGKALIEEALAEVKLDLHESDIPSEMVRNRAVMDALVVRKTIQLSHEAKIQNGGNNIAGLELAQDNYNSRLNKLIRITGKTAVSTDASGAGRTLASTGLWGK